MTLALTSGYLYPILNSSAVPKRRGVQVLELNFTAAATDVDFDIGDLAGAFWGEIDASAAGAGLLAAVTAAYPQWSVRGCVSVQSVQLIDRVQVASLTTTGQYTLAINSTTKLPEIAFTAADGEEAWSIRLEMPLNDDQMGYTWASPPAP